MGLRTVAGLALTALVVVGLLVLAGCAQEDDSAARRANAEAARVRTEAEAYQTRQQADSQAAAERANIRQMERDAAHQRTMETLPFVLAILGGISLAGLAGLMFWDLRRQATTTGARYLIYLERLQLEQAERDRRLWEVLGRLERRSLPAGDHRRRVLTIEKEE